MELVVKVIERKVDTGKTKFSSYKLLTGKGNWYRTSKISVEELAQHVGKVVVAEISRRFDKHIEKDGKDIYMPTLVVEELNEPTEKQVEEFEKALREINAKTLTEVN